MSEEENFSKAENVPEVDARMRRKSFLNRFLITSIGCLIAVPIDRASAGSFLRFPSSALVHKRAKKSFSVSHEFLLLIKERVGGKWVNNWRLRLP
jgi:hypothetical protein